MFALVVMAHLRAKTSRDARERSLWKFRLVKLLYERGYRREVVLELFRVIDWMMRLPDELERRFLEAVYELEEAKKMPYVTSAERFGIEKGLQQGLQQGLAAERQLLLRQIRRRFGAGCAEVAAGMLERIEDTERLAEIGEWVVEAEDGEAFLARFRENGRFS